MADHVTRGVLVEHAPTTDQQLTRYAGAFLAAFTSAQTRQAYGVALRQWFAWCRAHDLDPLTVRRTHVELWLRHLEERQLARKTRALKFTALRSFFNWLVDEDVVLASPCLRVTPPPQTCGPQEALTEPELHRFLLAARELGPYPYATLTTLALCALRISEACGADVEDLHLTDWIPKLQIIRKGDKPSTVVVPPQAMKAIEVALDGRTAGPLFLNSVGGRLRRKTAARWIHEACEGAGIDRNITPHALRRTAIRIALKRGVSPRDVQLWVDHADIKTTMRYDAELRADTQSPGWVVMAAAA